MAPRIDCGSCLFLPKPWLNQTFGTTNLVQHIHPCRPKNLPSPRHIAPKRRYATSLIRLLLRLKIHFNTPQVQNTVMLSYQSSPHVKARESLLCASARDMGIFVCIPPLRRTMLQNGDCHALTGLNSQYPPQTSPRPPGKYLKRPCAAFQHRKEFHFASKVNIKAIII